MKKFLNPEAEVLELNLADVICTSTGEDLPVADPNGTRTDNPAPGAGTAPDADDSF